MGRLPTPRIRSKHCGWLGLSLLLASITPTFVLRAEDGAKADAPVYEIKLARPFAVGTKYKLVADGASIRQETLTLGGGNAQKRPERGVGVHLEGIVEVLGVDKAGEEARLSCAIDKCTRVTAHGEIDLIPKGQVLLIEGQDRDTNFTLKDGGELPPEAADALDLLFSLETGDELDDDALFGTAEKVKIGDSWPVHPDAVARDAARVDIRVKPEDVTGSFTLEGTARAHGVDCLKLRGRLTMKSLVATGGADKLPAGLKSTGGSLDVSYAGLFPVDKAVGSMEESASMTITTIIAGESEGVNVKVETRVQRATEMRRQFLPKE